MDSTATQQCNLFPNDYAVYWLPPASSAFLLPRKMQLTGWENATDNMRNTPLMAHKFQMNGPTVHSCPVALSIFFKKIRVFTSLNHILQLGQFCGHLCNSTAYIILRIR